MNFRPPFPKDLPNIPQMGYVEAARLYASRLRRFYDSRARWHRRFFRLSGITVIVLGASMPLLANFSYPYKAWTISLAGVLIAVITALRSFYRWDQSWILLRGTEMAITKAFWNWEAEVQASTTENGSESDTRVRTQRFMDRLQEIRRGESDEFFKDLSFPIVEEGHKKRGRR